MNDKILPILSVAFFCLCLVYSIMSTYLAPSVNTNLHSYILISIAIILMSIGMILKIIMNFSSQNKDAGLSLKNNYKKYLYLFGRIILYILIIGLGITMMIYSSKYYKSALHNIEEHYNLNYLNYWIYIFFVVMYLIMGVKYLKKYLKSNTETNPMNILSINWTSHLQITSIWTLFMVILYNLELNKFSDDNSYDITV